MATAIAQDLDHDEQIGFALPDEATKLKLEYIPRAHIHPDPEQPRKHADAEDRESIRAAGMLQPIGVRYAPDREGVCADCGRSWADIAAAAEYMIIFGERRWRSSEGVLDPIPAIVRQDETSDRRRFLVQLIENHARKGLSPLEDARGFKRALEDDPSLSQNKLAKLMKIAPSTLKDRLALLRNEAWLPLFEAGQITTSQMVEVARYADRPLEEQQSAIIAMRDHAEQRSDGTASLAEMEVDEFTRALAIAFGDELSEEPVQAELVELTSLTAPPASESRPAESGRRHVFLAEVLQSGAITLLTAGQRNETLAAQPDPVVQRLFDWVKGMRSKLSPTAPESVRQRLDGDFTLLNEELALREAAFRDVSSTSNADRPSWVPRCKACGKTNVLNDGDVCDTCTSPVQESAAASTQTELDVVPANHSDSSPVPSGTAPTHSATGAESSEAPASADASASGGRREAGLPDPSSSPAASPKPREAHTPKPVAGGLFAQLAQIVTGKGRPVGLTIGPAKAAGNLRVTLSVIGKATGMGNPLVIDGSPAELDGELAAYVADYIAGKKIVPVKTPAASASAPSAAAKPAGKAKASTKKTDKYKPVLPKKSTPAKKPVAKKPAPKPAKKPAAPKVKKPTGLYPSPLLAIVLGSKEPTSKPKAIKGAIAYAKKHQLIGTGALRNAVSVDETLGGVVGKKTMVTLNELKKFVAAALSKSAPPAPPVEQIDLVDEIAKSSTTT